MKLSVIILICMTFTIFKTLYISEETSVSPFPTLTSPDLCGDSTSGGNSTSANSTFGITGLCFSDLSGGCSWFGCIAWLGKIIWDVVVAIIFVLFLLINIITFIAQIVIYIITINFTGIEDAPWWINAILTAPFVIAIGLILYKLLRSGKDEA